MKHCLFFLALSFAMQTKCMEPIETSSPPLPVDIIIKITHHLDLSSISKLLRTCSPYTNFYRKISRENIICFANQYDEITQEDFGTIQFGINRFLQQNPFICRLFNEDDHLTALVHYAHTNNKTMFKHMITNENSDNRTQRVTALEFFKYLDENRTTTMLSDVYNLQNNMRAYKTITTSDTKKFSSNCNINVAIQKQCFYLVKLFIKNKVNLRTKIALHDAIDTQNEQLVQLLIDNGADVHDDNAHNETPVIYASRCGLIKMVKLLIDNDAIIMGCTNAIHTAAFHGHADIVQLFLDHPVDPNLRNEYRRTPLHLAAMKGHLAIVQMLLNSGAKTTIIDKQGCTVYDCAFLNGHYEVARLIREKGSCIIS